MTYCWFLETLVCIYFTWEQWRRERPIATRERRGHWAGVHLCSWIQSERLSMGTFMIWDMVAEEGSAHRVSGFLCPSPKLGSRQRANLLAFSSLCRPAQGKVHATWECEMMKDQNSCLLVVWMHLVKTLISPRELGTGLSTQQVWSVLLPPTLCG